MEIKDYSSGDEFKILELFELVFKQKMSHDYWKWRFQDNPAGKHLIKLMWENDLLVGHYAVSPVFMQIDGKKHLSTLSMTTMTHPEYGGKGIFGLLSSSLYEMLESSLGVKAIWGFPNNNSHYGFIKNLKWKDLGQIMHLVLDSKMVQKKECDNVFIGQQFNFEHEAILQKATSQFKVSVLRDTNYLNWRFYNNPEVDYNIFEFRKDDMLQGFVVVKKYPAQLPRIGYDLFITEIGISHENMGILSSLLSHISYFYNQPDFLFHTWINIFDKRYLSFEKNGFYPGGKSTYLGVRSNPDMKDILDDYRNWYISYSDSDIY